MARPRIIGETIQAVASVSIQPVDDSTVIYTEHLRRECGDLPVDVHHVHSLDTSVLSVHRVCLRAAFIFLASVWSSIRQVGLRSFIPYAMRGYFCSQLKQRQKSASQRCLFYAVAFTIEAQGDV